MKELLEMISNHVENVQIHHKNVTGISKKMIVLSECRTQISHQIFDDDLRAVYLDFINDYGPDLIDFVVTIIKDNKLRNIFKKKKCFQFKI